MSINFTSSGGGGSGSFISPYQSNQREIDRIRRMQVQQLASRKTKVAKTVKDSSSTIKQESLKVVKSVKNAEDDINSNVQKYASQAVNTVNDAVKEIKSVASKLVQTTAALVKQAINILPDVTSGMLNSSQSIVKSLSEIDWADIISAMAKSGLSTYMQYLNNKGQRELLEKIATTAKTEGTSYLDVANEAASKVPVELRGSTGSRTSRSRSTSGASSRVSKATASHTVKGGTPW